MSEQNKRKAEEIVKEWDNDNFTQPVAVSGDGRDLIAAIAAALDAKDAVIETLRVLVRAALRASRPAAEEGKDV